jgi:DNA-binding NarL/FixJ family response regulator
VIDSRLILAVFQMHATSTDVAVERFQRLHQLTPAEGAVLSLLCNGRPLIEVALERASTISTVRRQLARIFRKSGCHTQRELVLAVQSTRLSEPTD